MQNSSQDDAVISFLELILSRTPSRLKSVEKQEGKELQNCQKENKKEEQESTLSPLPETLLDLTFAIQEKVKAILWRSVPFLLNIWTNPSYHKIQFLVSSALEVLALNEITFSFNQEANEKEKAKGVAQYLEVDKDLFLRAFSETPLQAPLPLSWEEDRKLAYFKKVLDVLDYVYDTFDEMETLEELMLLEDISRPLFASIGIEVFIYDNNWH